MRISNLFEEMIIMITDVKNIKRNSVALKRALMLTTMIFLVVALSVQTFAASWSLVGQNYRTVTVTKPVYYYYNTAGTLINVVGNDIPSAYQYYSEWQYPDYYYREYGTLGRTGYFYMPVSTQYHPEGRIERKDCIITFKGGTTVERMSKNIV